jgi:hypothetical protein
MFTTNTQFMNGVDVLRNWTPHTLNVKLSHVDVEEYIDADEGIVGSCTIADGDLINAVMDPDPESKMLDNELSDKEIATENISWAKAADAYSTLLKFAKSRPCYLAQEVVQLHILQSAFLQTQKECTKLADFTKCSRKSHMNLKLYPEE